MPTSKNINTESSQVDGGAPQLPPGPHDDLRSRAGNAIFKSGPLFISSKGIGWTSWKKRWFILTRTSLVFFRSDPSSVPPKGSEVNLTLGGIDLNNSGSVVVKADKRLLTVLFPDGRDGRAFTLKAENSEDLFEWKTALENALAQAPSATLVMGQNGIFKNDQTDGTNGSLEQSKDKVPIKALVIGRPVLLALEDVDGSPSFLEKALRYIEEHGIKVEGILRQAASVDDVEHRIQEYEQGKTEFSAEEDAHVIADCVKYFLRELPSSPVPASCCNALLEAFRTDRGNRVNAMRVALLETFPEPNRHLLQRILLMMQTVSSHKAENRMSTSAVAACMAPLLLRPLLAGDCEIENDFDVGGDGSIQLLQAAAAANHAQAIVITLMDEYDKIFSLFQEDVMSPGIYSDSEECESEDEEVTDDHESYEDDELDDASQDSDAYTDDDPDNASIGTESGDSGDDDLLDKKVCDAFRPGSKPSKVNGDSKVEVELSNSVQSSLPSHNDVESSENVLGQRNNNLATGTIECNEILGDFPGEMTLEDKQTGDPSTCMKNSMSMTDGSAHDTMHSTVWGRSSARKNLSMESIDCSFDDETEIQKLEAAKIDLQHRISEEVKGNAVLQANLEQRKKALLERRLVLEQDVARLQEELQKERDKRTVLEAGLKKSQGYQSVPVTIDEKMRAELEEISQAEADVTNLKQKVDNLHVHLYQQRELNYGSTHDSSNQPTHTPNHQAKGKDKQKDTEANATSQIARSANKDTSAEDSCVLPNKQAPQNQQLDPVRNSNSRPSTSSKKSSSRSEGMNATTSALTKLTTRLNFLKERRSQLNLLNSELDNMNRGHNSGEVVPISSKVRGSESSQASLNRDKGQGTEGPSHKNSEKSKKSSDSHQDGGKSSEGQDPQNPDKGRSEDHLSHNLDKPKGSGSQTQAARRTNSR